MCGSSNRTEAWHLLVLASGDSTEETDKRDGKVISVSKMNVAARSKDHDHSVDDKLRGTTSTDIAEKQ